MTTEDYLGEFSLRDNAMHILLDEINFSSMNFSEGIKMSFCIDFIFSQCKKNRLHHTKVYLQVIQ